MKKLLIISIVMLSFTAIYGQPRIGITNITGLPVLPDTAYEAVPSDTVSVTIMNLDSTLQVIDTIFVLLQTDTAGTPDTLISNTAVQLNPGDSVVLQRFQYFFSSVNFDDGDNIVVVWPASVNSPVISDTTTVHIYFVSLTAGVDENDIEVMTLYPNPATEFLSIQTPENIHIKRVRIYDISGKQVFSQSVINNLISISGLTKGVYFISAEMQNGLTKKFKIVKTDK